MGYKLDLNDGKNGFGLNINDKTSVKIIESTGTIYKVAVDEYGTGVYKIIDGWSTADKKIANDIMNEVEKIKCFRTSFTTMVLNHIHPSCTVKSILERMIELYEEIEAYIGEEDK